MTKYQATHTIIDGKRRIPVYLIDSVCYTKAEWETGSTADWEIDDDGLLMFQGQRRGRIEPRI